MKIKLAHSNITKYRIGDSYWFILREYNYDNNIAEYYLGSERFGLLFFMYGEGFLDSDMDLGSTFPTEDQIKDFISWMKTDDIGGILRHSPYDTTRDTKHE